MEKEAENNEKSPLFRRDLKASFQGLDFNEDQAGRFESEIQGSSIQSSEYRSKTQVFSPDSELRSKTSLRMLYEAQAEGIQKQIGSLEDIRLKLGLSARKICQLLMVDPSAWNRWTKPGGKAPPHVWRSLQWYLSLQDKLPGLSPQYFVERVVARGDSKALEEVGALSHELEEKLGLQLNLIEKQSRQIQSLKKGLWILSFALGSLALVLFLRLLFQ